MEYVFCHELVGIIICSEVPVNMHVEILHVGNSILDDILNVLQSKEWLTCD